MSADVLSALSAIDPAALDYQEWVNVGMALKHECFECIVWDNWSRSDARYKRGECERKWRTFEGSASPVTGATIIKMAQDRGWSAFSKVADDAFISWGDEIEYDGDNKPASMTPNEELAAYLKALFDPKDIVGYVTSDVWIDESDGGKVKPRAGSYTKTAGYILDQLSRSDDISYSIGDWNKDAGAWIRFNPLDGRGVKNENVTAFRFALVESDDMPQDEQERMWRRLELPIAALVDSGGKSIHAIVHIDAKDYDEYRERVNKLYSFIESQCVKLDKQNRNPSRLSRMPGVTRGSRRQRLLATNIGRRDWDDWLDYLDGVTDTLPKIVRMVDVLRNMPPLKRELIHGVLREGHKMIIQGPSKAGKSFALIQLAIAIAEGIKWMGKFEVEKGKVLYINFEIDGDSFAHRVEDVCKALGIDPMNLDENLHVWNLRGRAQTLDELYKTLIRKIEGQGYVAVIFDPIYKIITGDENSAKDMGAFCNLFDAICREGQCAAIYCHHHSKGAQGGKKSIDRGSGSGVFGRDPDAIIDMTEIEIDDETRNGYCDGDETAYRIEGTLREFKNFKPFEVWFKYPLHVVDEDGILRSKFIAGSPQASKGSTRRRSRDENKEDIRTAFNNQCMGGKDTSLHGLSTYLGISERTLRDRLKDMTDEFRIFQGRVFRL